MSRTTKIHLLIIDPQNDFMGNLDGTPYTEKLSTGRVNIADLAVPGAVEDMMRLAKFVDRVGRKLDDIHVTLDSHRLVDVGHAPMWIDSNGNPPKKFTQISVADIEAGLYTTRHPSHRARMLDYARKLEAGGKYKIMIWSDIGHCLIGTWGHNVFPDLKDALLRWENSQFATVDYVTKGSNSWTEHYGGLMAEVEDPNDPTTSLNTGLLEILAQADIVVVAGEASSHCVLTTVNQIAENIGEEHVKKFHLLSDCMSPVPAIPNVVDFPAIASSWLRDMERRGMTVTTSIEFLK